ncbi:phage tail protein [Brucella intermedia]|uniref:phage tail protein n=1 Tax=Brucella intermedia TaxID=94625 RepID=UPI003AB39732
MATKPITAAFPDFVLEVETETEGTFAKICALTQRGINRQHNMQTTEVPQDCDDESLPSAIERAVQSSEVTISASGVWSSQSHKLLMDWWYSGQTKNIRVQHVKAAVGDTEYETGPAYLVGLNNAVEKGQKVSAELDIQFDGVPARTAKVAP